VLLDTTPGLCCRLLGLLPGLDITAVHAHNTELAAAFLERLGLRGRARRWQPWMPGTAWWDGCRRQECGRRSAPDVRGSYHLYNDMRDVELAAAAVRGG
jgi:hypothetical protein